MPFQIILIWIQSPFAWQQNTAPFEFSYPIVTFIFGKTWGDYYPVLFINSDNAAIKSPVQIRAKGNAIGNGVVVAFTKGYNMAGVDHRNIDRGIDPQPGNAAGVIINFWNFPFEDAASQIDFFLFFFTDQFSHFSLINSGFFIKDFIFQVGDNSI